MYEYHAVAGTHMGRKKVDIQLGLTIHVDTDKGVSPSPAQIADVRTGL